MGQESSKFNSAVTSLILSAVIILCGLSNNWAFACGETDEGVLRNPYLAADRLTPGDRVFFVSKSNNVYAGEIVGARRGEAIGLKTRDGKTNTINLSRIQEGGVLKKGDYVEFTSLSNNVYKGHVGDIVPGQKQIILSGRNELTQLLNVQRIVFAKTRITRDAAPPPAPRPAPNREMSPMVSTNHQFLGNNYQNAATRSGGRPVTVYVDGHGQIQHVGAVSSTGPGVRRLLETGRVQEIQVANSFAGWQIFKGEGLSAPVRKIVTESFTQYFGTLPTNL